jgi:hypothetical protein
MSGAGGFHRNGYALLPGFFSRAEIAGIAPVLAAANRRWMEANPKAVESAAINSAYLTSSKYCPEASDRQTLFRFIAADKMVGLARDLMGASPFFMNTQLFFNPVSGERRPYWHRDVQYLGVPEADQKEMIFRDQVLHFRVPLARDPGLEFVPGSHARWDNEEERNVRLGLAGRAHWEALPGSTTVPHAPGDLLVFSAHLLHKGIYAGGRFSFDVIFSGFASARADTEQGHFPDEATRRLLPNSHVFAVRQ